MVKPNLVKRVWRKPAVKLVQPLHSKGFVVPPGKRQKLTGGYPDWFRSVRRKYTLGQRGAYQWHKNLKAKIEGKLRPHLAGFPAAVAAGGPPSSVNYFSDNSPAHAMSSRDAMRGRPSLSQHEVMPSSSVKRALHSSAKRALHDIFPVRDAMQVVRHLAAGRFKKAYMRSIGFLTDKLFRLRQLFGVPYVAPRK